MCQRKTRNVCGLNKIVTKTRNATLMLFYTNQYCDQQRRIEFVTRASYFAGIMIGKKTEAEEAATKFMRTESTLFLREQYHAARLAQQY
jgi:hypothetical protein